MIDASHAIAHYKIMIIDGETVITGSFKFRKAAEEKNGENLLVIRDIGEIIAVAKILPDRSSNEAKASPDSGCGFD